MKVMIQTAGLGLILVVVVVRIVYCLDHDDTVSFYQSDLRSTFFGAFLTLAGFLLSLKTFIVMKLKEMLYDSPSYIAELDFERNGKAESVSHYGPLKRLSSWIAYAIALSLLASAMQFTVGLLPYYWAVLACLAVAASVVYCLSATLVITNTNLRDMFKRCEKESLAAWSKRERDKAKERREKEEQRAAEAKAESTREFEERQADSEAQPI